VLVAGGTNVTSGLLSSTELFNPNSGTWSSTGSLINKHWNHTATLLTNGQVLITGGNYNYFPSPGPGYIATASAELYDPVLGTWKATNSMTAARVNHTATLLPNGQVLVTGGSAIYGFSNGGSELYDPIKGAWTQSLTMNVARSFHTATMLTDGSVLVAGGYNGSCLNSAELYGLPFNLSPTSLPGGAFSFSFTYLPGASLVVKSTSDLSLPLNTWTIMGGIMESSRGQFQFTDPQATNAVQRFYRVTLY
jgi:hypothetical protein